MQGKSILYLGLGTMLCLVSITPCMADTDFQGTIYQWSNWNNALVYNKPTATTTFTVDYSVIVTYLRTFHWNNRKGVDSPGTITLIHDDGTKYGPYQMKGSQKGVPYVDLGTERKEGVPNVDLATNLNSKECILKPGTYTVIDSDPNTWSRNEGSKGAGFFAIKWETNNPTKPAVPIEPSASSGLAGDWNINANGYKGTLSIVTIQDSC